MADYEFLTTWRFKAPQEKVWDLNFHSENWPEWWPGVEKGEKLQDGDSNHVGAIHRYTWKSKLPYRLIFEMETTRVEPVSLIEGRTIGEFQGVGRPPVQFAIVAGGSNRRCAPLNEHKKKAEGWSSCLVHVAQLLLSMVAYDFACRLARLAG